MTGRRLLAASVVVALAGLAAIVTAGLILADGNGAVPAPGAASGTVAAGVRAPAIMGRDPVTGATVSLARVKKKPIVLAVWASWCTACARQASALSKFAQDHRQEAAVIGLDLEDEPMDARGFYERYGWTFRSIADPEGRFAARLGIGTLPTTLFFDRNRMLVARISGVATRSELERGLAEAKRRR